MSGRRPVLAMTDKRNQAMLRALLATVEEARHHLMDARSDKDDTAAVEESLETVDDLLGQVEEEARNSLADSDLGVAMTPELLREAAHAIRGPLGASVGHLDLLRDGRGMSEEQVGRSVQAAWEGAAMADRFIQEFFDIANAWAKRPVMPTRPVSVTALLSEVLDVAEAHAKSRRVHITRRIDKELRRARVDPDGFEEMVEMMVEHAIDAAPAGSDVDVVVRPEVETVRIEVSHTGSCPWPPKRHFQPFEPAEPDAPIGITALRELARMRAGDAGVETRKPGELLWFEVPDWKHTEKTPAPAPEQAKVPAKPLSRTARVLVVEDDRADREAIQTILREAGYEADVAVTVDAAVEAVENGDYDAITLDLLLGRSYSMRVLAAARTGRNRDAAILALSATRPGNVAFPFPVQAHLQKPVKKRVLLRALRWGGVPPPVGGPVLLLATTVPAGLKGAVQEKGRRLLHAKDADAAQELFQEDPSILIVGPGMDVPRSLLDVLQGAAVILWGETGASPDGFKDMASAAVPEDADPSNLVEALASIVHEEGMAMEGGSLLE